MQFIKINETYAVNADRIGDVSYTSVDDGEEETGNYRDHTQAKLIIRIAGTSEVEERVLEGPAARSFWDRITGASPR